MKLPRYPKYKDSGVKWLGQVPEHWEISVLKRMARTELSNVDKKTADGEASVSLCNYLDVYRNEKITAGLDFMVASASDEQISRLSLQKGDVIITKDSESPDDIGVPAFVSDDLSQVVCGYHLALMRPYPGEADGLYIARAFKSKFLQAQFSTSAVGMTRFGLGKYEIENVILPKPPREEQTRIAEFLDHQLDTIDALTKDQEHLIELLKEKRQAVISHAVTKGLIPDAPMKQSGVRGLGAVPEHWDVTVIKRFSTLQRGHDLTDAERTEGPYPVVTSGGVNGTHGAFKACGPGVVTGRYGSTGRLFFIEENFWPHNTSLYVSDFHGNFVRFVWYALHTVDFAAHSAKSAVPGIDRNDIHVLPVVVPPHEEQLAISHFLDSETARTDQLIAEATHAIDLLQERRTALITAAVTGQIDVRGESNAVQ